MVREMGVCWAWWDCRMEKAHWRPMTPALGGGLVVGVGFRGEELGGFKSY